MSLQESIDGLDVALDKLIEENKRLRRDNAALLGALKFNWTHTDDGGTEFWCNCPAYSHLEHDASGNVNGERSDSEHSTVCATARAAIRQAEGDQLTAEEGVADDHVLGRIRRTRSNRRVSRKSVYRRRGTCSGS